MKKTDKSRQPFKRQNIVLIGYMGSGKTTIGKKAARALNYSFYDTDECIEEEEGCSISELFSSRGEEYFRKKETETLQKLLLDSNKYVIATGGGIVKNNENIALLKQIGIVVYLKCSVDKLLPRLRGDSKRPLLAEGCLEEKVAKMVAERNPLYETAADVILETDGKSFYEMICFLEKLSMQKRGSI